MEEFLRYQRRIMILVALLAGIAGVVVWVVLPERWTWSVGGWWGAAGGLVVLRYKVGQICRAALQPDKPSFGGGFVSFLIMVAVLGSLLGANRLLGSEIGNLWGAFAGLLLPNAVLMLDGLLRPAGTGKSDEPRTPGKEDSGEA